jgi:hypothetical protein
MRFKKPDYDVTGWEYGAIGICGCGDSDTLMRCAIDYLGALLQAREDDDWDKRDRKIAEALKELGAELKETRRGDHYSCYVSYPLGAEMLLQHLDHMGFLEHGGSVYGSWLDWDDDVVECVKKLQDWKPDER